MNARDSWLFECAQRARLLLAIMVSLAVFSCGSAIGACNCGACSQQLAIRMPNYEAASFNNSGLSYTQGCSCQSCSAHSCSAHSCGHQLCPQQSSSHLSCGHQSSCLHNSSHHGWGNRLPTSNLEPLDRYKKTFFQLSETEAAWIGTDSDLRVTEVNSFLRVAVPLDDTFDNILAFQPGFRSYFLDGPTVVDVPEALYDAQLSIVWRKTYSERWQTNVWLQPKVRSDFETSDDIFFFSGGAYARYTYRPNYLDFYIGAFYLDRDDISVLPAVGFVWTPTPDWRFEALLPRPKIARRIQRLGNSQEKWLYLSGQLGGGSFGVLRANGENDKLTLRDLRLFLGLETVRPGGGGLYAEVGYVFNRGIEYSNNDEVFEFDDALMLRAGIRY